MRKLTILTVFLAASVAALQVYAQQRSLPQHFGNWSGQANTIDPQNADLADFASLSKEAGYTGTESFDYSSGAAKVHVELQKFRDPSSAYEIYTALIRPDMHPSALELTSAVDGDKLYALLGNSILKLRPTPAISMEDLNVLVKSASAHSDKTPLPPIRTFLPGGFVDGSQKYALGPEGFRDALNFLGRQEYTNLAGEAGFNSGAEAMFAHYASGKGEGVLLLLDYPTPQLAEQHLRHLNQSLSVAETQAGTVMERNGTLLEVVLRPSSVAYSAWLRSAVGHETQVTWHEPTHTITDPPLLSTVAKIIIATVVFMVVAVALGAAFGGVRVLAKRLFPGKVFDRPERMDVLQLGLSSKRIDSRDFY